MQAVENIVNEHDCSKPFVANLESSSQLEDSVTGSEAGGVVIDATPLPVKKRTKWAKNQVKMEDERPKDENKEPVSAENRHSVMGVWYV